MIWSVPNASAFIDRIHQELSCGKNVVCILPKPCLDNDFTSVLDERLYNNGQGRLIRLDAASYTDIGDLYSLLHLGWNWEDEGVAPDEVSKSLENLWQYFSNYHIQKFVAITGLEQLPESVQKRIAQNVSDWARFSQQSRSTDQSLVGLCFLILVSPTFPNFSTDLLLITHHWWAQIDLVDHQWALNHFLTTNPSQSLAQEWWLKSICRAIAYDDLLMMELVIEHPPFDFDQIKALIQQHPLFNASRALKPQSTTASRLLNPLSLTLPKPPNQGLERTLWANGLFSYNPHNFPHPVIMDDEQLRRCISLGQRQVLLPLVDHVQTILCNTIEELFGAGVWEHYEKDNSRRSSIVAEISPLAFFLKNTLPSQKWPNSRDRTTLIDLAFAWREIRHSIAHNNMLNFSLLKVAFDKYEAYYCIYK